MNFMRAIIASLTAAGILLAQEPPKPQDTQNDARFGTTIRLVLAPVTVLDRTGRFVSGLTPYDFRLLDNGKPQRITEDVAAHPISLVVAIQANHDTELVLKQVQKLANVFGDLVLGDTGEVAIIGFDHRIQTMTPFTNDVNEIREALKKLKPGSLSSNLNDAVMASINMLKRRPDTRRRVVMVIAESNDKGSSIHTREVLTEAEFANVVIYPINVSHMLTSLTTQAPPNRPDNRPPGAVHLPAGVIDTPTLQGQNNDNFVPMFTEIFKAAKGFFVRDPLDIYSKYTGGRQYSFMKQGALERAVQEIGEELHSQYLLTYSPNNLTEAGFHEITVTVLKPDLKVTTRRGYWTAAVPQGQ
jgi:VWFA-related protein